MTLDEIDALFIDVGGTLIHPRRGVQGEYAAHAKALGLDIDPAELTGRFTAAFDDARQVARAEGRTAYGATVAEADAFWRRVVGEVFAPWGLPRQTADKLYERLYAAFARADAWTVFPDVAPLLAATKKRGLPVVVVSNWDARLPEVLESLDLVRHFTAVVGSYAVGSEKPDAAIFRAAIEAVGMQVARDRILHVGDSLTDDVRGAETFGLRALHLDRGGKHPGAPGSATTLAVLTGVS